MALVVCESKRAVTCLPGWGPGAILCDAACVCSMLASRHMHSFTYVHLWKTS